MCSHEQNKRNCNTFDDLYENNIKQNICGTYADALLPTFIMTGFEAREKKSNSSTIAHKHHIH